LFDALIQGNPIKHFVYSLNVDTGATNAGWPVDLNNAGIGFTSLDQEDRGALALVNGIVYVPFSGYLGDCGNYRGFVVGVHIDDPSTVGGWHTQASKGGIWGHSGVASDGTNMFVITGNTVGTGGTWGGWGSHHSFASGSDFYWQPYRLLGAGQLAVA
jgi:hypothetical protein